MSARQLPPLPVDFAGPRALPALAMSTPAPAARRDRIWELSPNLHCSIIGTCLPTSALRQLFAKLNQPDARTASDHDLHGRAVVAAGQRDLAGKLLNRMLEKRHEKLIRRFTKAKTTNEVRALWREALERGDIPGAYWAALTHPATDQPLVSEVFGEVHMLSHLVGTSNRADIVRLRELEGELGKREEKITRQEIRLQRMARERQELVGRLEELEHEVKRRPPAGETHADPAQPPAAVLKQRLENEQTRSAELAARLAEQEEALCARDRRITKIEEHAAALRKEVAALGARLADFLNNDGNVTPAIPGLAGRRMLYVGGRPKQLEQMRATVNRLGGVMLTHDGGIEESTTLLPGLVGQADIAFFPVDCISHRAMGLVKRFCREMGKPFVPLRSAGVASFLVALEDLQQSEERPRAAE